jgi:Xaa-Pro dipeptidase
MGKIQSPSYFKEKYEVDEVRYVEDLDSVLSEELKAKTLYLLHGKNTDSGNYSKIPHFAGIEKYKIDKEKLHPILSECRVIKSSLEIDLLKYVNKIASEAHKEVMRRIKPGMMEYQMEAIFCYECYYNGGCRHVSYTCICASGENASILHYGHSGLPNSKKINEGEMVMFDMGCEYHCYASDISRSFPVSGKFTLEQKQIYESVLAAQEAVMKAMKPGVSWVDMHKLSNRVICEELKKYGFLKGDIDEMMKHHIGAIFMPHGLGHFMGIDTHDVGGYNGNYERINEQPGLKNIRTVRVLEPGMVLTVEPGIYFIDSLLDKALADPIQSQFLVKEKIQQFRNFGGVRIEDDVIVTENGIENMTTAPRTVEEIEKWMSNKDSN